MPVVINRHHYRAGTLPEPHVYIGRGTPLGNEVSKRGEGYSEEELLRRYERDLMARISRRDASVLDALNKIGPNDHLVCSCKPAACHGDVVLRVWEWLAGKGEF